LSMEYVRKMYNVPAKRGTRICYHGLYQDEYGTIVNATQHIRVKMDATGQVLNFHPTWNIEYLPHIHLEPRRA
jgi:hypothetical protein